MPSKTSCKLSWSLHIIREYKNNKISFTKDNMDNSNNTFSGTTIGKYFPHASSFITKSFLDFVHLF